MKSISVVMTTYNGSSFLVNQIESILSQTKRPDEIVIVDDASTDNTFDILKEYQERYPDKIKIFRNVSNLGISKNFEKAAQLSIGDFIFFSDQDDIWEKEKIQTMIGQINGSSLLYSNAVIIDENDRLVANDELQFIGVPVIQGKPLLYLIESNSISGHNILVTRDLLNSAIPFPQDILYDQWLGVVACLRNGIIFTDKKLVKHRMHCANAMNNPEIRKKNKTDKKVNRLDSFRKRSAKNLSLIKRIFEIDSTDQVLMKTLSFYVEHLAHAKTSFFNRKLYRSLLSSKYFENIDTSERHLKKISHRMSRGELYFRLFMY